MWRWVVEGCHVHLSPPSNENGSEIDRARESRATRVPVAGLSRHVGVACIYTRAFARVRIRCVGALLSSESELHHTRVGPPGIDDDAFGVCTRMYFSWPLLCSFSLPEVIQFSLAPPQKKTLAALIRGCLFSYPGVRGGFTEETE